MMCVLNYMCCFLGAVAICCAPASAADWPTQRGNAQRTGNIDGMPGPQAPRVLWVHKSTEHFIAAPMVAEERLVVAGFGAFNTSRLYAFSLEGAVKDRVVWSKSAPYLKLAVASSPACAQGRLVFGDGMHQDNGAVLHGLSSATGVPLWQYSLAGELIHLEGAPTVAEGRVYIGGGNAGVLCVDMQKLTLGGKEVDAATAQAEIEKAWQAALAKFAEDKKKDPDFALPPSEDSLPKPQPKLVWQQGAGKWHVDAAVSAAGGRVYAATAFLDTEKIGERAVVALNASDGSVAWKAPLKYNPWGGATVAGELLIVGSSNIRYEPKTIPQGKGEVVALAAATGEEKWKVNLPAGGVVSAVAVSGELAVCTATDGKVRALDLKTGEKRWIYDAKAPYFAGVAIAGNTVYAADLRGVVHALALATGQKIWTLEIGADPAVQAPGMVYGAPVVHGGRLYVATCNVESESGKATAVVCLGDK